MSVAQMYTIHDSKAIFYHVPLYAVNDEMALRNFESAMREGEESDLWNYAEDFTLFHVGWWDEDVGQGDFFQEPRSLARGWEVKSQLIDQRDFAMDGSEETEDE